MKSTFMEFAVLPLVAGAFLGTTFCVGGDASKRMLKSFTPSEMLGTSSSVAAGAAGSTSAASIEGVVIGGGQAGGSAPGRHVAGFGAAWGLRRTEAADAWRLSNGSKKIVVAVIDTGIDTKHPDLRDNLWTNPGESGHDTQGRDRSSNGVDDDGNGFIDDVHGWNFVFDNDDISDNHGHGTHIAGIIGATGASRVTGVAPSVSLMVLKYFDPTKPTQNPLEATVRAIHYAVAMGANVINYSGGGVQPSSEEYRALQDAASEGVLVVAAAGNEHVNSDRTPYYPADYGLTNIMSVTAINSQDHVLSTSNYGVSTVDIAAPGEDIFSTVPGGWSKMTGTSQATAFATGVAVLVMAAHPELRTPRQVIDHIIETGETRASLVGKTRTRAVLNAYRAVSMSDEGVSVAGVSVEETESFVLAKVK